MLPGFSMSRLQQSQDEENEDKAHGAVATACERSSSTHAGWHASLCYGNVFFVHNTRVVLL